MGAIPNGYKRAMQERKAGIKVESDILRHFDYHAWERKPRRYPKCPRCPFKFVPTIKSPNMCITCKYEKNI